jgi:predicted acylesterase/phospholipase RssA
MAGEARLAEDGSETIGRGEPIRYILALTIGALVGAGLAATWVPERPRRRLPAIAAKRYRRVRRAGSAALEEIRGAGRELSGEFREELGATLEAAREEFRDMARQQLEQVRKALRRERRVREG